MNTKNTLIKLAVVTVCFNCTQVLAQELPTCEEELANANVTIQALDVELAKAQKDELSCRSDHRRALKDVKLLRSQNSKLSAGNNRILSEVNDLVSESRSQISVAKGKYKIGQNFRGVRALNLAIKKLRTIRRLVGKAD